MQKRRLHGPPGDSPALSPYARSRARAHLEPREHQPGDRQTSAASTLRCGFINCKSGTLRSFGALMFFKNRTKLRQPLLFLWADPPTRLVTNLKFPDRTAKNYHSAVPLICAHLNHINIYTITVTILR